MGGIPAWLLRAMGQDVTVEPFEGDGSFGPAYGPVVTVRALVEHGRRLVRDQTGTEVVSETTLRVPLGTVCPAGSRVTLPDGTRSTVITARRYDGGMLPVPSHLEAAVT